MVGGSNIGVGGGGGLDVGEKLQWTFFSSCFFIGVGKRGEVWERGQFK